MAFTEDLAPFFSTDDFAIAATYDGATTVNAVAMEPMLKLVLLSHSSPENLTKHWVNTASVEATGVPCHPCHRLHRDFTFCAQHPDTQFAACQSAMSAEAIAEAVLQYLAAREKAAA